MACGAIAGSELVYSAENLYSLWLRNVSPGRSTVEGKSGRFGKLMQMAVNDGKATRPKIH